MTDADEPLALSYLRPLLTKQSAGAFVGYKMPDKVSERLEVLAAKSSEGRLTDQESREYELTVQLMDMVAILYFEACELAEKEPAVAAGPMEPVRG